MKRLIVDTHASSCYFRTSVGGDGRKALVQITERCNLHCAHCFVSSTTQGCDLTPEDFTTRVLPRLLDARVQRITLTGGEPFVHPDLIAMCQAVAERGLPVGICTNATQTTDHHIAALTALGNVHINVSFDGFRPESHGRFRGDRSSFATTLATTRKFAQAGLLKGLLSTPNALTVPEEFADLCAFGVQVGAEYVLMNPLSSFGRGVKSRARLAATAATMNAIRAVTDRFADQLDLVHIRFPNDELPLGGCDAGKLICVFVDGQVAICPYLVFAARTPASPHRDTEFLAGNILDADITADLDGHDFHTRYQPGGNPTCGSCALGGQCGKGCPAAVVAAGGRIGDVDADQCPVTAPHGRRLLPLAVAEE
ncbi:radical SAM protein [Verrucosispora sp. WMMC514]|uniref:radical SAM protein n=1 Tax=Verrucosispora sp. WMMC514 TaxID=3015156 RepID=UPI00248BD3F7|nr:radical SAM protein [Verrucosispora sp. WMMC514]WBB91532.1 radical SAM protein [Verrucosispora sp. WMMC514]